MLIVAVEGDAVIARQLLERPRVLFQATMRKAKFAVLEGQEIQPCNFPNYKILPGIAQCMLPDIPQDL